MKRLAQKSASPDIAINDKNKIKAIISGVIIMLLSVVLFFGEVGCQNNAAQPEPLDAPENLHIEGKMLLWDDVKNASGYVVYADTNENYVKENSYDLAYLDAGVTYTIEVWAVDETGAYDDSAAAEIMYYSEYVEEECYDEAGLKYVLLEDGSGYEVSKGSSDMLGEIYIPDYVNGMPVKSIADNGFYKNYDGPLVNLDLRTGAKCNRVTTAVRLPKHLESIGDSAFACFYNITEIVIPDGVVEIGKRAFVNNAHLTKVVLPKGLKVLREESFRRTALDEIILPQGLEIIESFAFGNASPSGGRLAVQTNVSEVVIPDSVVSIGEQAFANRDNLKTLVMSENIEHIAKYAFSGTAWYEAQPEGCICFNDLLYEYKGDFPEGTTFTVPLFIKKISENAFAYKKGLKKIVIPDGVILDGSNIFDRCTSLEEAVLPSDLKELPDGTFSNTGLKSITLPDGLEVIGKNAFSGTANLKRVTLPDGLEVIGKNAFSGTANLKRVTLPDSLEVIEESAFRSGGLTEIVIPDSVTTIGQYAFSGCRSLLSVTLGKGVKKIEKGAFEECTTLFEVYNLSDLEITPGSADNGGVGYYAKYVFDSSSGTAGNIETTPDGYVFYNDDGEYSLIDYDAEKTELVLPEKFKGHDYSLDILFENNKNLEKIIIPDSIASLPADIFNGCINLKEVVLPGSLTAIPDRAFYGCYALTKITPGEAISEIGKEAFAFSGVEELEFGDALKNIGDQAFFYCGSLRYVDLGDGVESIGAGAFKQCKMLNKIIIPVSVKTIGIEAFYETGLWANIFYEGNKADMDKVSQGRNWAFNVIVYYYSETEPPKNASGTGYDDYYWRYASDNATPVIWQ